MGEDMMLLASASPRPALRARLERSMTGIDGWVLVSTAIMVAVVLFLWLGSLQRKAAPASDPGTAFLIEAFCDRLMAEAPADPRERSEYFYNKAREIGEFERGLREDDMALMRRINIAWLDGNKPLHDALWRSSDRLSQFTKVLSEVEYFAETKRFDAEDEYVATLYPALAKGPIAPA